jgi:hypothetical protein
MIPIQARQKKNCSTHFDGSKEYSRLITAAVINQHFCKTLLTNPEYALATGYAGEPFNLTSEQKNHVLGIQAKSLTEFASQLAQYQAS